MRIGDRITFVDAKKKSHAATVTAVVGAGRSNWKRLDVSFAGGTAADVPHSGDQDDGEGFWLLATETAEPPERRADPDKQPIALAEAEATGALPSTDRRGPEPD